VWLGHCGGVRFVNSAAPPPIIKFVKARGICFALMEHNDSVAMVEVDCNKLKREELVKEYRRFTVIRFQYSLKCKVTCLFLTVIFLGACVSSQTTRVAEITKKLPTYKVGGFTSSRRE
jgi:hypothetical protein